MKGHEAWDAADKTAGGGRGKEVLGEPQVVRGCVVVNASYKRSHWSWKNLVIATTTKSPKQTKVRIFLNAGQNYEPAMVVSVSSLKHYRA